MIIVIIMIMSIIVIIIMIVIIIIISSSSSSMITIVIASFAWVRPLRSTSAQYGQFSKFHVCFCGLDSGNLKFETVRTNLQHIYF